VEDVYDEDWDEEDEYWVDPSSAIEPSSLMKIQVLPHAQMHLNGLVFCTMSWMGLDCGE
jgi:hypothetical protein